ncbi:phosphate ABC transporter permease PstA [Pasteurella multocida]|uniref:phosphate ABC transporter permease PstA n=1 Tax=Pasteurella multocida TaxID=747 RepID=UPI0002569E2C|nr:phosphate ABC transporter permease PstA [Pasteurella multocida]AFF23709.1 phosphate transporter permease subunit PtsA [Pasteurella multocida subsp. multocida str. HN06]MCL7776046.1 phosphate ABC transporter permease PstA [Pasteurella multocida]MCL8064791.1 phosphate ABC transporter permease PstA [Pasteurella multocida]MCL8065765.1 phosphate ABC transporter permease PstA [Pasteurella multocida]MCW4598713.1 phosphate ABC transporter permease PstA [Pasteurella multocida subsp. multocida]
MSNTHFHCRKLKNKLMLTLSFLAVFFGLFWLCWILFTLITKGIPALSLELFLEKTPGPGEKGGLLNAIIGSTLMITVSTLIGTPIGILAGTYLAEYGHYSQLTKVTRFLNDVLLSAPSIVIGLFIYAIYVSQVKHYSGWAGAFALAIIIIPVVVRTTDNMLNLVPNNLREAAASLGCPQWRVITMICYRSARAGILTGVLLSIARISGETAPLLFTALSNQFTSFDMNGPMANIPIVIYQFAASPFQDWNELAWAGATLITLFVLLLNIFARIFFPQKSK